MLKKIYNVCFIVMFMAIISLPLIKANWTSGGISEDENRYLAEAPKLTVDGKFNDNFTAEVETWFMDHMGYRKQLIDYNAKMQYEVFERMLSKSNYYLGRYGDINYATDAMIMDYAHLNLRSDEEVKQIGESYQVISDWLDSKGIQFYYVQCWDKHSIYPEQFMASVNQIGDVSKTDQVINYLREYTTVNELSLKETLVDNKKDYEVYSNWGDPTHWSERGSYIGYKYIIEGLNKNNDNKYKVLKEDDYNITISDKGITLNGFIHEEDMLESFTIKNPMASKVDKSIMGKYGEDKRHSVWKNPDVDNDTKLLLVCDSYINSFIIEDIAESFSEVWLVWGDYTKEMESVVELYNPDIVIYECAERVDRSKSVVALAELLTNKFTLR